MTPNPNPSPESVKLVASALCRAAGMDPEGGARTGYSWIDHEADARTLLAALSPQTLPAPGEVERYTEDSVRAMLRGTTKGETLRAWCKANDVNPTHAYEFADGKRNAPADLLGAMGLDRTIVVAHPSPTLATVAAANDEGVAEAIEAAAKVADDLCADMTAEADAEPGVITKLLHRASAQTAEKIAAAIRLLPQGGRK
ncbi:hypothetical protein O6V14_04795 [Sphingomonas faeni]|uniref:hypothetical protein n=1 Tax=Sphingomonas faeni TaxID=185950 RepID=UPI00335EF615